MKWKKVERRFGWDTHWLPIENIVEKKLEIKWKEDLEWRIWVFDFNETCRKNVFWYVDEWKKTVEGAGNFFEYVFLDDYDLKKSENIIKVNREKNNKVVIFLTLQDLQCDSIKDKHKELFKNQIDLLIVDETHFGARAESFGKILGNNGYQNDEKANIRRFDNEKIDIDVAEEILKQINAEIRIHLSGTPYRILMGSEFEKEDIISFVQFSDIVKEQKEWDKNNLNNDDMNEWDNPYYGFPQMIRFAFNPNKSSREKMEELKKVVLILLFQNYLSLSQ